MNPLTNSFVRTRDVRVEWSRVDSLTLVFMRITDKYKYVEEKNDETNSAEILCGAFVDGIK